MSAKKVVNGCCPYCGSTHGFYYYLRLLEQFNGRWGEVSSGAGYEKIIGGLPKTAKCIDCDRRVDRRSAEGE